MVTVWIVMVTGCFVAQCPGLGQHGEGSGTIGGPDHCEEWGQVSCRAHRYVTMGVCMKVSYRAHSYVTMGMEYGV